MRVWFVSKLKNSFSFLVIFLLLRLFYVSMDVSLMQKRPYETTTLKKKKEFIFTIISIFEYELTPKRYAPLNKQQPFPVHFPFNSTPFLLLLAIYRTTNTILSIHRMPCWRHIYFKFLAPPIHITQVRYMTLIQPFICSNIMVYAYALNFINIIAIHRHSATVTHSCTRKTEYLPDRTY